MVSPVFEIFREQLEALKPSFLSKRPHFNFLTVHYFWVVGMSFLLSILLYATADGQLAYIDALFFGAGANTQAGLNPVDVNLLNTFQQVAIMIFSMMSNPIAINSFVVFLRLFWFEKKFQSMVQVARSRRGTITKTKSKARPDMDDPERGVNGRDIRVMHGGTPQRMNNDGFIITGPNAKAANSSSDGEDISPTGTPPPTTDHSAPEHRGPGITFAGVVKRSDGMDDTQLRIAPRSDEEHIAILQRQRNNENEEVLRIPGPRDVELGERPRKVGGGGSEDPEPQSPSRLTRRRSTDAEPPAPAPDRPKITIKEPAKPSRKEEFNADARAFINVFTPFKVRRSKIINGASDPTHDATHRFTRRNTLDTIRHALTRDREHSEEDEAPYLSFQPTLGRNSQFVGDLTDEEREELGGIEYRSLKTLAVILTCYFWGFWILGVTCMTPWIYRTYYRSIVESAGANPGWWGVFTSSSAFTDLGFTLTPDSMNSFITAVYPLLIMSFFIVIGNTGFPVMLRLIIWITSRFVPRGSGLWEELRFLLDHPRRCFTLLFPAAATWWLFWLLVLLNGLDLIFFIVLDLGSGVVAELPAGLKILGGVFQAFSTRTAGFSCVNLSLLHPGVQTSYMIMMYISIFPIAMTVRRTNVYEESSLGIYHKGAEGAGEEEDAAGSLSYVGQHLRRQLSFDLWYIFIGFFILSISEGTRLQKNDFSMFAVLFEIVSAYGTVGLSLGYTNINASLSSQFSTIGKLVIIAMQIRGRHRGLPYGLDRAVLLPSESRFRNEGLMGDDGQGGVLPPARTLPRRNSGLSVVSGGASMLGGNNNKVNRVNSNVLARMLHPGPAVPPPLRSVRSLSDVDGDQPGFSSYRTLAARSETYSMGRRSVNNTRVRDEDQ